MSNPSDFDLDLDLQLLPAWARQPAAENRYAQYEGETEDKRPGGRGPRGGWRDQRRERPPRRGGGPREGRPRESGPRDRGPRRPGPAQPREGRAPEARGGPLRGGRREETWQRPREMAPLPAVSVSFTPEDKGVESLARQIRLTGRAYPLFEIAALILKRPDRFHVKFHVEKGADGKVLQPLYVCSLDESAWLTEDEVVAHVLKHHFATFYQTERVAIDPPKGTYTFVAQCGLSGVILGPPNYHDYQNKLRRLHADRYSRMQFEDFKARVKIVKDEAVVKQWIDEQSWRTEFVGLNLPEPVRLANRETVEKHFREVHLPNLIKSVESFTLAAGVPHPVVAPRLQAAMRSALDDQRRFPLRVATTLSQQFASLGLQFFKVDRTVTHVSVARPHYLDLKTTVVSDGIRRIVEFIDSTPKCNRKKLIEALAPTPAAPASPPAVLAASEPNPGATTAESAAETPAVAPAEAAAPTLEQASIVTDLHWLIHQGHVIEFTDGRLETARAPKPKPAPQPRPDQAASTPVVAEAPTTPPPASSEPTAVPASAATSAPEPAAAVSAPTTVAEVSSQA